MTKAKKQPTTREPLDAPETTMSPEEEKRKKQAQQRKERAEKINAAKATLQEAMRNKIFDELAKPIINAINTLSAKTARRATAGTFKIQLDTMFPEIGVSLDEIEVFKQTKMGRREFAKRTNDYARRCSENRDPVYNFSFDEKTESWTLVSVE